MEEGGAAAVVAWPSVLHGINRSINDNNDFGAARKNDANFSGNPRRF
jgi:hypothetical protein